METGSQLHLGIMHVGTVLQEGYADTSLETGRQRLGIERGTRNLMSCLAEQQGQCILRTAYLTAEVVGLRLC